MFDWINTDWLIFLGLGYLGGYIVGSFTRNISLFKIIIFITLYLAFAELLPLLERIVRSSSSLSLVFCLGILTHHRDRILSIISWANDLKDVIFALRYRRAFEEIKRKEEELQERERRFREEQL